MGTPSHEPLGKQIQFYMSLYSIWAEIRVGTPKGVRHCPCPMCIHIWATTGVRSEGDLMACVGICLSLSCAHTAPKV